MAEKVKAKVQISISVRPEVSDRLAEIAAKSGRSRSNLGAWIIEQALRKGDYED